MESTPKFGSVQFECPSCRVMSQQTWFNADKIGNTATTIMKQFYYDYRGQIQGYQQESVSPFVQKLERVFKENLYDFCPQDFSLATCSSCSAISLWINDEIVHPRVCLVAPPNKDMNQDIQEIYLEASKIVSDSPKGATALLRLALQLLLQQLGKKGSNINSDIKELVSEGLSPKLQKALDLLRVVGNNAVHPGQIDLNDGRDIALKLFHVLNFIADEMISKPKELELLYADIVPDETKKHIDERDGK